MVGNGFLVVGAGALGLATAEALLQQGETVTLLEQGAVGQESSWAGGGILSPLCPWDYPEAVTQLASRGANLFAVWATSLRRATGIDPEFEQSGMLVLPPLNIQVAQHWCAEHGVNSSLSEGGLLLPDVTQVRNPRLLKSLRARVEQLGARIVEHCEVQEIQAGQNAVHKVKTSRGEFVAENYIVTAGAWSKQLLRAQAAPDIKPMRGQMLLFKFDAPPLRHIVLQAGLYLIPRRDGHLLAGSTLEDVGFDKSTTGEAREMLQQRAAAILPALHKMQPVKHWAGLRPGSPENIPTIARHPVLGNLFINSGHFRYGVTMAPASVEILMNEINGAPQPLNVRPYQWKV